MVALAAPTASSAESSMPSTKQPIGFESEPSCASQLPVHVDGAPSRHFHNAWVGRQQQMASEIHQTPCLSSIILVQAGFPEVPYFPR